MIIAIAYLDINHTDAGFLWLSPVIRCPRHNEGTPVRQDKIDPRAKATPREWMRVPSAHQSPPEVVAHSCAKVCKLSEHDNY